MRLPKPWWLWGPLGSVLGLVMLALGMLCLTSGCSSVGYLTQAAGGHLGVLAAARPVAEVLADPATPEPLAQRLRLTQGMRAFAVDPLGLPDNDSYRRYADLGRTAAVWNVVAAPEFSLRLQTWCFPIVGCVGYRGYYSEAAAQSEATQLRAQGLDVQVYPVPAYSTLGWSDWVGGDPLLNTFIQWSEADLARLIFHELAHQRVYVPGDTAFNESYATAVERLGGALWLQSQGQPDPGLQQQRQDARRAQLRALTARLRADLEALYAQALAPEAMREAKRARMAAARQEHEQLKQAQWDGWGGFDAFMAGLNNASLGVQSAYLRWVPAFERLFEQEGRRFGPFHQAVARLGRLPAPEREAALQALMSGAGAASSP